MQHYVGLDVSLKQTAVCVVDPTGKIKREGMVASDPDAIAASSGSCAALARIGLETGATSTWLWTELEQAWAARHLHRCPARQGRPEDADQQKRSQRRRRDCTDHAVRMVQRGPRQGPRQSCDQGSSRSRALLVETEAGSREPDQWVLKNFGLVIGRAKMTTFVTRAKELIDGNLSFRCG